MNTIQTAHQLALDFTAVLPAPKPEVAPEPEATPPTDEELSPREQRLADARAVLAAGLADVRDDPEALARYLAFAARFHDYSPRNRLLIFLQRPTARFCKGYRAWQAVGRQVRKGERGLAILAPILRRPSKEELAAGQDPDQKTLIGFRATKTFDYAQTDAVAGDALVYAPPLPRLESDGPAGLFERLTRTAKRIGYAVVFSDLGYAAGRCAFASRTITLSPTLSGADRCSVLTHELAHAVAHAPGEAKERPSKEARELQAEGAAFVALGALGLDTGRAALPYLKGWAGGDDEALQAEIGTAERIARDLLDLIDEAGAQAA
jgi:hypothetical protein